MLMMSALPTASFLFNKLGIPPLNYPLDGNSCANLCDFLSIFVPFQFAYVAYIRLLTRIAASSTVIDTSQITSSIEYLSRLISLKCSFYTEVWWNYSLFGGFNAILVNTWQWLTVIGPPTTVRVRCYM